MNDSNVTPIKKDTPMDDFFSEMEHWDNATDQFLAAWKEAIHRVGEHYFNVTAASVDEATDKNQLRPNPEQFEAAMNVVSHGTAIVLANLYCFYNVHRGQRFIDQLPDKANPVDQFSILDLGWRRILTTLLMNYKGW